MNYKMKGECSDCGKKFESHAQTYIVENRRICRFCWTEHKRQDRNDDFMEWVKNPEHTTMEKREDAA